MKNLKHFTRLKQLAALKKLFSPPPDKKLPTSQEQFFFLLRYAGIYRHLLPKCRANDFSDTPKTCLLEKF